MSGRIKNPDRMIVTLNLAELDAIVEAAVERVLVKKKPAQLQFTINEVALRLNVTKSWLGNKVRAGELPHHRHENGHRIFFTQQDIDEIIAASAVFPDERKELKT